MAGNDDVVDVKRVGSSGDCSRGKGRQLLRGVAADLRQVSQILRPSRRSFDRRFPCCHTVSLAPSLHHPHYHSLSIFTYNYVCRHIYL